MSPEFRRAIGYTLWGIAAVVFVAGKFLQHRLSVYVHERYPEKAKVRWWRGLGKLAAEAKTDPALRQYYRQMLLLTWLEGIMVASAAMLSGWHVWIF